MIDDGLDPSNNQDLIFVEEDREPRAETSFNGMKFLYGNDHEIGNIAHRKSFEKL